MNQYKWDFFLDANENPELKGADPDKTIFKIHDLPEFTKRTFDGSTLLDGAEDAAGATENAATQLLSYVNQQVESLSKTQRRKFNTDL